MYMTISRVALGTENTNLSSQPDLRVEGKMLQGIVNQT